MSYLQGLMDLPQGFLCAGAVGLVVGFCGGTSLVASEVWASASGCADGELVTLLGGAESSCAVGGAATNADAAAELAGSKAGCKGRLLDNIQTAPTTMSPPIVTAAILMFARCAAAKVGRSFPFAADATRARLSIGEGAARRSVVAGAEEVAVTARNDSGAAVSKSLSAVSNWAGGGGTSGADPRSDA